jgi:hypothetical protein
VVNKWDLRTSGQNYLETITDQMPASAADVDHVGADGAGVDAILPAVKRVAAAHTIADRPFESGRDRAVQAKAPGGQAATAHYYATQVGRRRRLLHQPDSTIELPPLSRQPDRAPSLSGTPLRVGSAPLTSLPSHPISPGCTVGPPTRLPTSGKMVGRCARLADSSTATGARRSRPRSRSMLAVLDPRALPGLAVAGYVIGRHVTYQAVLDGVRSFRT